MQFGDHLLRRFLFPFPFVATVHMDGVFAHFQLKQVLLMAQSSRARADFRVAKSRRALKAFLKSTLCYKL